MSIDTPYRLIDAKYAGRCAECAREISTGDEIWYAPGEPVLCGDCTPEDLAPPPVGGTSAATAAERETGEERTKRLAAEKAADDLVALRLKVNDLEKAVGRATRLVEYLYVQLDERFPE